MTRYLVLSFALLAFISACTVIPPAGESSADHHQTRVRQLLMAANLAFENDRLTTPAHDNALARFRQVLELDPANVIAIDGINRIVEKYLAWALDYAERPDLMKARYYVAKAEEIDRHHPNIQPVVNKINDQEERVVSVFKLDAASVRNQAVSAAKLDEIARLIERHHAFVIISAPNDKSGRWLYQELNSRVEFRVQAQLEQSSRASVSLTR